MSDPEKCGNDRGGKKGPPPTASYSGSMPGPGSRIGRFRIERELGRGGMGVVYLAHDTKLDRSVAIKSLPPEVMSNETFRSRLKREARILASLNHPNIAAIYEQIEEPQSPGYLVLEHVVGRTLAERIASNRLPLDEALPIATDCRSHFGGP
jgi:serine/threonine protein kinase